MKKTVKCLAVLSSFVLGVSVAYAGGNTGAHHGKMHGDMHAKMHKEMYKAMDTDADGAISSSEFDAFHANKFRQMDANGDGKITPDEMKMHKKMGGVEAPRKSDGAPGKFDYYKTRKL